MLSQDAEKDDLYSKERKSVPQGLKAEWFCKVGVRAKKAAEKRRTASEGRTLSG